MHKFVNIMQTCIFSRHAHGSLKTADGRPLGSFGNTATESVSSNFHVHRLTLIFEDARHPVCRCTAYIDVQHLLHEGPGTGAAHVWMLQHCVLHNPRQRRP